jgi:Na+-transporting methylmalonyl-CoA/oxaloacetate decarboxylase gamma subunit
VYQAVEGSSVFPEGFLPSFDSAVIPALVDAPAAGVLEGVARAAPRTRKSEPTTPPVIVPPDADGVIDGAAQVLAPSATRRYRRRSAAVLLVLVLVVVALVVGQVMRENTNGDPAAEPSPTAGVAVPPDAADQTPDAAAIAAAAEGFTFAGGYGPVLGSAGTLRRFKVAVEERLGPGDGGDFADEIDRILGDPRSWTADRQLRLQRVPAAVAAEFTVYLASAGTSEKMCAGGGLKTAGFTSCRLPGEVIINSERWAEAVPDYDAPVAVYRAYAINHEVGHQLGHGHEACAGPGEPAPVMMQQTYGLQGCVANSWPYLRGQRYAGNPID